MVKDHSRVLSWLPSFLWLWIVPAHHLLCLLFLFWSHWCSHLVVSPMSHFIIKVPEGNTKTHGSLVSPECPEEYILLFGCRLLQLHLPYITSRLFVLDYVFLPHGVFVVPFLEAQEPTPGSLVGGVGGGSQRCCFPLCVS